MLETASLSRVKSHIIHRFKRESISREAISRNMDILSKAFPRAGVYSALSGRPAMAVVRERADGYGGFPYTERHLQCVWSDPAFRPARLNLPSGESVLVEHPGRWNLEAGPDFLDSLLIVEPGGRRVAGDVEVHIRPGDWKNHGHGCNPRYGRVAVHVTYFPGDGADDGLPAGVIRIPLRDILRSVPHFSFENIDVSAYPYAERSIPAPCRKELAGLPWSHARLFLEAAGQERLKAKARRIVASVGERGAGQVLYEEVLCALGFKNNRLQFRKLASVVPAAVLHSESGGDPEKAFALLLGVSGLIPAGIPPRADAETKAFIRKLWNHWWKRQAAWSAKAMRKKEWRLAGTRPQNHPVRRMAAAATLFTEGTLLLETSMAPDGGDARSIVEHLTKTLLCAGRNGYWSRRFTFTSRKQPRQNSLLGEERIAALITNVFVPFMAATGGLAANCTGLLDMLRPENDDGITRRMAYVLFGRDHNPNMFRTALMQQGLHQVFGDFCLADRSACRECPLPSALAAWRANPDPVSSV